QGRIQWERCQRDSARRSDKSRRPRRGLGLRTRRYLEVKPPHLPAVSQVGPIAQLSSMWNLASRVEATSNTERRTPNARCRGLDVEFDVRCSVFDVCCRIFFHADGDQPT